MHDEDKRGSGVSCYGFDELVYQLNYKNNALCDYLHCITLIKPCSVDKLQCAVLEFLYANLIFTYAAPPLRTRLINLSCRFHYLCTNEHISHRITLQLIFVYRFCEVK